MVPQSLRNLSSSGAAVSSRPGRINAIWRVPSRSFRCCASFQAQGERQKLQQQSGQKSFQDSNLACPWPRQDFATPKKSDRPLWNAVLCSLGVSSAGTISDDAQLPPEVQRVALFTDAPEALPVPPKGLAALWRYQGP